MNRPKNINARGYLVTGSARHGARLSIRRWFAPVNAGDRVCMLVGGRLPVGVPRGRAIVVCGAFEQRASSRRDHAIAASSSLPSVARVILSRVDWNGFLPERERALPLFF
jgi:hypothetical protein